MNVYKIDDGEQHWYVARSIVAAMEEHTSCSGGEVFDDNDEISVLILPEDEILMRTEVDYEEGTEYPEGFVIDKSSGSVRVSAAARDWAKYYEGQAPTQIATTVF